MTPHSTIVSVALGLGLLTAPALASAASCSIIEAVGVAFGGYDVFSSTVTTSTGRLVFQCQDAGPIAISLGRGGSSTWLRRLSQGLHGLDYNLFLDAAGSVVWGDASGGTSRYTNPSPPDGESVSVTIYGRIPARQNARVGAYSDTIVATLEF